MRFANFSRDAAVLICGPGAASYGASVRSNLCRRIITEARSSGSLFFDRHELTFAVSKQLPLSQQRALNLAQHLGDHLRPVTAYAYAVLPCMTMYVRWASPLWFVESAKEHIRSSHARDYPSLHDPPNNNAWLRLGCDTTSSSCRCLIHFT